jgi:hypothetical protein
MYALTNCTGRAQALSLQTCCSRLQASPALAGDAWSRLSMRAKLSPATLLAFLLTGFLGPKYTSLHASGAGRRGSLALLCPQLPCHQAAGCTWPRRPALPQALARCTPVHHEHSMQWPAGKSGTASCLRPSVGAAPLLNAWHAGVSTTTHMMAAQSGGLCTRAMGWPSACATSSPSLCLLNTSVVPFNTDPPSFMLAGSRSSLRAHGGKKGWVLKSSSTPTTLLQVPLMQLVTVIPRVQLQPVHVH